MAKTEKTAAPAPKPGAIPTNGANLKNIPIDRLGVMPSFNPRTELGDISDLVGLIKAQGLINPLAVCPVEQGADRYYIVAGGRRFAAVKELGYQNVACHVYPAMDIASLEAKALAMAENDGEGRQPLSALDQARAYQAMMAQVDGKTDTDKHKAIARALGRRSENAHQNIRLTLKLLTMPERVQTMLAGGLVSKTAAVTLVEMPDDIRDHVAERIAPGMSEGDVRRVANEVRREGTPESSRVVDLESVGAPADPDAAPAAPRQRNRPAGSGDRVVLWRSKGEVRDKIAELVVQYTAAEAEGDDNGSRELCLQIAALLWCTGSIDDVTIVGREFNSALKELVALAESTKKATAGEDE